MVRIRLNREDDHNLMAYIDDAIVINYHLNGKPLSSVCDTTLAPLGS
jgi:hypothetical protein